MEDERSNRKLASAAAYIGAFLFVVLLVLFSSVHQIVIIALVSVAFHLILLPVVAELPAPEWGRAAGYGWLVIDIALNVAGLNGVDLQMLMSLRLGAHVVAAVWIITSSLRCSLPVRTVGILQGICFAGYSLLAPWVPSWGLYPSAVLLVIWLFLAGRMLGKS